MDTEVGDLAKAPRAGMVQEMSDAQGAPTYGTDIPSEEYRVPDPKHVQVPIDTAGTMVDEKIAPLVAMVNRHGLTTQWSCQGGDEGPWELAYIIFPVLAEGVEFLEQTMYHLDFRYDDQIALTVTRPMGVAGGPGAKVTWVPGLTGILIEGWSAK